MLRLGRRRIGEVSALFNSKIIDAHTFACDAVEVHDANVYRIPSHLLLFLL